MRDAILRHAEIAYVEPAWNFNVGSTPICCDYCDPIEQIEISHVNWSRILSDGLLLDFYDLRSCIVILRLTTFWISVWLAKLKRSFWPSYKIWRESFQFLLTTHSWLRSNAARQCTNIL